MVMATPRVGPEFWLGQAASFSTSHVVSWGPLVDSVFVHVSLKQLQTKDVKAMEPCQQLSALYRLESSCLSMQEISLDVGVEEYLKTLNDVLEEEWLQGERNQDALGSSIYNHYRRFLYYAKARIFQIAWLHYKQMLYIHQAPVHVSCYCEVPSYREFIKKRRRRTSRNKKSLEEWMHELMNE